MKKLKKKISLIKLNKIQLIKKINTLDLENEILKKIIKDELYKDFINKSKVLGTKIKLLDEVDNA